VPETSIETPWMTPAEAASYARRSFHYIHVALRTGKLRGVQAETPSGKKGRWLIHRDQVDAWIRGDIAA
jgi:excisionase family DNA binding protein